MKLGFACLLGALTVVIPCSASTDGNCNPEDLARLGATPEIQSRRVKLRELCASGVRPRQALGLHGTSVEALNHYLRHGRWPTGIRTGRFKDRLFIAPINANVPAPFRVSDGDNWESAYEDARTYADSIARSHAFLGALGLELGDLDLELHARRLMSRKGLSATKKAPYEEEEVEALHALKKLGFTMAQLKSAHAKAKSRRGIILAFDPAKVPVTAIGGGDPGVPPHAYEDATISIPDGQLPLDWIQGIELQGQDEWDGK